MFAQNILLVFVQRHTDFETGKKIKADVGSARKHPSSYPTWQPVHMATES